MPQFSYHTPMHPRKVREILNERKLSSFSKPIGVIADGLYFQYGYNGETYWVAQGSLSHLVTTCTMSIEEAKCLYNAFCFVENNPLEAKEITKLIAAGRKTGFSGDNLFWFYVDKISI